MDSKLNYNRTDLHRQQKNITNKHSETRDTKDKTTANTGYTQCGICASCKCNFSAVEYFLHLPFSSVHLIKVFAQDSFVVIYSALRVA